MPTSTGPSDNDPEPGGGRAVVSPKAGSAYVAAFSCRAIESFGRECGFPLAVITATADLARHAARLAATWHGAFWPQRYHEWPLAFDCGLLLPRDVAYAHMPFDPRWLGSSTLPSGIELYGGALRVALPPGATVADLAAVLRSGLADLSVDRVARRPERVRYRYATQRPVVIAPRYALVTPGDVDRVVVADDLYAFRSSDFASLAGAVALSVESIALTAAIGRLKDARAPREASHG